jgi:O-antigen/teichoic acid export membrane protein
LGLGQSYQYHIRKSLFSQPAVISHILAQLFLTTIATAGLYLFGRSTLRFVTGNSLSDGLIALTLVLVVLNIAIVYLSYALMALPEGVKRVSIYSIIGGVGYIALLPFFLFVLGWGVLGAVLANTGGVFLRGVPALVPVFKGIREKLRFPNLQMSRTLLGYGLSVLLGNLMMASLLRIDTFIVNSYLGTGAVGIYSVAVSTAELMLMIPSAVGVALFPYLTSASSENQVSTLCHVGRISLFLGVIGCLLVALLGYPFILIMFGERFSPAFGPLLWLLPGLMAMTLTYGYANFFNSRGRPFINGLVFGAGAMLNVLINLFLIPMFGISGAAIASSLTYCSVAIGFIVLVLRTEKVCIKDLMVLRASDIGMITQGLQSLRVRGINP